MTLKKNMHTEVPVPKSSPAFDPSDTNLETSKRFGDAWLVIAVMGVVWGLLKLWSYPSPFPDESLRLLVEQTGTWPRLSPLAPLWNGFGCWVASLGAGAMQSRMQLAGHVTLAVSAGLFYRITVRFISIFLDPIATPRWSPIAVRLVGIGSVLFLMCCPPVWRAAQSPHPAIFGLFLATAAMNTLLRYAEQRTLGPYLLWAALTGVGIAESPLVLLFLPAWIGLLLWLPWGGLEDIDNDDEDIDAPPEDLATTSPSWRWLLGGAVIVVTATACITYAVQTFNGTDGYALRGFSRRLDILQFFAWNYFVELQGIMPPLGWLIVLVGLLLPWLLAVTLAKHVQVGEFSAGKRLFYLATSLATVVQLTGIESVQIWSLLPSATFRVGACLISAMTFGLVAAAWLLEAERVFRYWKQGQQTDVEMMPLLDNQSTKLAVGIIYLVMGGCMLGSAGLAIFQRRDVAERTALGLFQNYTSAVVEDADDCDWIVTDGVFDDALRLEAWRTGSPLQPIYILPTRGNSVLNPTERRLPDPESRTLFSISPHVMLREWLAARPEQASKVAAQLGYDLWVGTSVKLSPQRTLFHPVTSDSTIADASSLMDLHRPFWRNLEARLAETKRVKEWNMTLHLNSIRNNTARVANEVGVLAQDEAKDELAMEAYATAWRLNPDNISAALNLWTLSQNLGRNLPSDLKDLPTEIKRLSLLLRKSSVLGVIRLHGTIRTSQALSVLAAGQLQSGGRSEALARVDAALRLLPTASSKTHALRATAASLQWLTGNAKGGRESYLAILEAKPADINALLGLAVLEAKESGLEAAVPLIDKARQVGATPLLCDQLQATLYLEANAPTAAQTILQPYVVQQTRIATVWYLWGWVAIALQDLPSYELAQTELQRLPNSRGSAESLASKAAMATGDLPKALLHAKAALSEMPENQGLLESVLRLCTTLGEYDTAKPFAKTLLTIDTGHALARYVLGTQLLLEGDAAAAEPLLARSASTARHADTLNNLACAQLQLNKLDEASVSAKAAFELAPERAEIWDTVAAVAIAQELPIEAESAARQALLLNPNAPDAWLRLAEAVAAGGNLEEAKLCLARGNLNAGTRLTPDVQRRLERLQTTFALEE